MDYSTLLNSSQLDAVTTASQYVRIVAGAGSGKTRVLTYRISYLISDMGVDPRRILAIAFTNKVANEMRNRAAKLLEKESSFVRVMTFHSFCAYFLRQEAHKLGYPTNYTILDEDDQSSLVKDIGVGFGYKKGDKIVKNALEFIRINKGKGIYPEFVKLKFWNEDEKECLRFYKEYEIRKTNMYGFDFDDLLLKTIEILENNFDVRKSWANRFDHILVDEFQDVNDIQYKLMTLLSRPDSCIYVVGDPDQTIYTWRGANQDIIMKFDRTYMGAETIILNRNYRSTKKILSVANTLISKNRNRIPKDLFTEEDEGCDVVTRKLTNAEAEADYVAREVAALAKRGGGEPDYRGIAILYRSSYLTRPFETEFGGRGIPYKLYGGLRFYQRAEVKDALAYFRLITNPLDDVSFQRIVNVPRRGVGEAAVNLLRDFAAERNLSLFNAIALLENEDIGLTSKALNGLLELRQQINDVKAKLEENLEVFSTTLKDFVTSIGYFDYLIKTEELDEDKVANVNALFDDMNNFVSRHEDATFEEFLQNVTLLTSQDDIKDGNFVTFMTIHIAKGLEFDNVFVIGLSSAAFPNPRAVLEGGNKGMEEERRLAYVAMTRAKKKLYLTCNVGFSYVSNSSTIPSVFFTDAGLPFPCEDERSFNDYDRSYGKSYPGWRSIKVNKEDQAFFDDGNHLSPFDKSEDKEVEVEEKPKSNGIHDWKVGDKLNHQKFGDGEVISLLGNNIIIVNFETEGKKTLVGDHPMISRISSKGGQA